jgi:hypothetical protein
MGSDRDGLFLGICAGPGQQGFARNDPTSDLDREDPLPLHVIGAGLSRTGTLSLKVALEQLGFAPCQHMLDIVAADSFALWTEAMRGRIGWDEALGDARAIVDFPAYQVWRQLAELHPDARVILTVRDPQSWAESMRSTIVSDAGLAYFDLAPPHVRSFFACSRHFELLAERRDDPDGLADLFRRHNQQVIDGVAPERLLRFHPRDGWGPLCRFLGVAEPDRPFPRTNERAKIAREFEQAVARGQAFSNPAAAAEYVRNLRRT